jgi:membrane-associated PAP2 superfamily phosphatase
MPERDDAGRAVRPWRLYRTHALLLAATAVAMACVFHFTRLDLQLAAPYYDPVNHAFPWRFAWVSKYFVHRYVKYVLLLCGIVVWIVAAWSSLRPRTAGFIAAHRRRWWLVAWSAVLVPGIISVLRLSSSMHCPWDVTDFGGYSPYFDLLSAIPAGTRPGRCFPAGFVASGSWLLAFALLWYPERKRRCLVAGIAALLLAFGLGWVQQMRGAHFLSHTLWSLWISWAVVLLLHALGGAWRERGNGPTG